MVQCDCWLEHDEMPWAVGVEEQSTRINHDRFDWSMEGFLVVVSFQFDCRPLTCSYTATFQICVKNRVEARKFWLRKRLFLGPMARCADSSGRNERMGFAKVPPSIVPIEGGTMRPLKPEQPSPAL